MNSVNLATIAEFALGTVRFFFNGLVAFNLFVSQLKRAIAEDTFRLSRNKFPMAWGFNIFKVIDFSVHKSPHPVDPKEEYAKFTDKLWAR